MVGEQGQGRGRVLAVVTPVVGQGWLRRIVAWAHLAGAGGQGQGAEGTGRGELQEAGTVVPGDPMGARGGLMAGRRVARVGPRALAGGAEGQGKGAAGTWRQETSKAWRGRRGVKARGAPRVDLREAVGEGGARGGMRVRAEARARGATGQRRPRLGSGSRRRRAPREAPARVLSTREGGTGEGRGWGAGGNRTRASPGCLPSQAHPPPLHLPPLRLASRPLAHQPGLVLRPCLRRQEADLRAGQLLMLSQTPLVQLQQPVPQVWPRGPERRRVGPRVLRLVRRQAPRMGFPFQRAPKATPLCAWPQASLCPPRRTSPLRLQLLHLWAVLAPEQGQAQARGMGPGPPLRPSTTT